MRINTQGRLIMIDLLSLKTGALEVQVEIVFSFNNLPELRKPRRRLAVNWVTQQRDTE